MVDSFAHESIGLEYRINLALLAKDLKAMKSMLKNAHASMVAGSKQVEKAFNTVTDASKKMGDQQKKSQQINESATAQLKRMGITSKTTTAEFKKLNFTTLEYKKIARLTTEQMKDLSSKQIVAGKAGDKLSDSYDRMGKRLTHTNFMVRKQIGAMGDSQRAMERWSITGLKAMALSQLAWLAMGSVIFGTMAAIAGGLSDVTKLHQRLKNLQAVTQATTEDMQMMELAIRTAAVSTKFFAADMSDAAVLMAQAGFSAQEVADSIGAVAVLASATGRELKDVADLMTSIIRAYDLNASEATRVVNVLASAISESKLQIDTLITALNFMGVAANQFNISLESTVAWLGILRDRGLKASTIGTSFRGVLATLVRETDKFSEVLSRLDTPLAFSDVTIRNGRRLEDTMERLQKAGFNVIDAFEALPRRTAMTFSLMVQNVEVFRKLREEVTATNRAFEMNITTMTGLQSQLAQTKSIFDEFIASLTRSGGALETPILALKTFVQIISAGVLSLTTLVGLMIRVGAAGAAMAADLLNFIDKVPKEGTIIDFAKFFLSDSAGLAQVKGTYKAFADDITKITADYIADIKRLAGKGGLVGGLGGTVDTEEERKKKEALETISILRVEEVRLLALKTEEEERVGKTGKAWENYRDKLILVNAQIRELENETLGLSSTMDEIFGPIKKLDDILFDLGTKGKTDITEKSLLSIFTKGKEDIDLITKAVKVLRKELSETIAGRELDPSQERLERIKRQAKVLSEAIRLRGRLQKQIDTDADKAEKERIKNLKRMPKLMSDALRALKKRQREEERSVKLIERQNLAFDRLVEKRKRIEDTTVSEREKISEGIKKILLSEHDFEVFLINKNAESRRRDIEKRIRDAELLQKKLEAFAETTPFFREAVGPEIERLSALILELKELLPDIGKRRELELGDLIAPRDFVGGIKKGLEDVREELEDEAQIWQDIITNTAQAMTTTMSDLFFDAMTGKLVSLGDAWRVFSQAVQREIANMAAKWVTSGIIGTETGGTGLIGLIAGLFSGGGGNVVRPLTADVLTAHQGGIISAIGKGFKMHSGGEVTRRLRVGEYVLREPAVRSLGEQNLNQMNRTGQMPTQQRVVNNYNTYVQAMDVATFDTFLRNSGSRAIHDISLNSVALGRRRRDPRVR